MNQKKVDAFITKKKGTSIEITPNLILEMKDSKIK